MSVSPPAALARRDAVRNRAAILVAARQMATDGQAVQLNAVARAADVGVGTVYRHFPTVDALVETLVEDRFTTMAAAAQTAALAADPAQALRAFLSESLQIYVEDDLFAAAAIAATPVQAQTEQLRTQLGDSVGTLLEHARRAGAIRSSLSPREAVALLCGVALAVRMSPPAARREVADRYLDALLGGMLAAPAN